MEVLRAEARNSLLTRPVTYIHSSWLTFASLIKKAMQSLKINDAVAAAEVPPRANGRVLVRASGTEPLVRRSLQPMSSASRQNGVLDASRV